jgi:acetyltransferase-like isoleucine patch superfamily enzyme
MLEQLRIFFAVESTSPVRYWAEQVVFGLVGWMPSLVGILLRAIVYRPLLRMEGWVAIQSDVILKQARNISLQNGVYLDHGVYIHACPNGVRIGSGTRVMYGAELHVFNFRDLPNAGITIGSQGVVGPYSVIFGHGGTSIGNNVIIAPRVSILPINHYYDNPHIPIRQQGIEAKGIRIEDDAWIGAGAKILDGVCIGRGSVVGAGAVVTQDVSAYTMVVGVPARPVQSWAAGDRL